MDSMLGYVELPYKNIGLVPAKADDVVNYIPARLSALLMLAAGGLMGLDPPAPTQPRRNPSARDCWACAWRGMRGTTACCTKRSISATHRGRSPTRTSPVCAA